MAVAVVTAAALLMGTTAQNDSLRIDQPAGGAEQSGPEAVGRVGSAPRTSDVQGQPATATRPDGVVQRGSAATTRPAAQSSPKATPRPTAAPGHHQPMTRRTSQQVCPGNGVGVDTSGVIVSGDWCLILGGSPSRGAAPTATLALTICRHTAKARAGLNYSTSQETDFTISVAKTKKTLWQWSTGQRFRSDAHVLMVGGTECYTWETGWDWRDDRGRPVASGQTLRLTAESTSRELAFKGVSDTFPS
jgi:hypothetical protein